MSIRHLDSLFDPASVAVIGASERPASVGATVWRNLSRGRYAGPVYAVNPKHRRLGDAPCYPNVEALPQVPELAVICTPPATVPGIVAALARAGTRAAVVLTAGLDAAQKQAMLDAARPALLRILGPNGLGLLVPHSGLNASFAHIDAQPGELAFISQSGALVTAMLDWADAQGIGFSCLASIGEHADVDFGDLLDYLATDARTRAILLYVESVEAARKFMSAARAAARNKPVIVVKSGRSEQGQRAAASHTGALAGSDAVYDAAIARAGMLRVDSLQDLFLAAETLARFRSNRGEALTVLTNGGGAGVMAADAAAQVGVPLAELAPDTLAKLDAVLPPNWSHGNPVDIIGDAPVERYVRALETLCADPAAQAVLFIHAPTAIVPSADIARALAQVPKSATARLMGCWLGGHGVAEARQMFKAAGIADYPTPEEAVRAFAMLRAYHRAQAELIEAPSAAVLIEPPDVAAARALVQEALAAGRTMLSEPEAKAVLDAYRIPVVSTRRVPPEPQAAVEAAAAIGYPVALKILSPDLTHKSDVGGVALALDGPEAVREAAEAMLARVRRLRPEARIEGYTVQAMASPAHARELIVGATVDRVFGPVILFGHGGTAVEVLADRAVALPPLNEPLARSLIQRTRVARLLQGWRDTPGARIEAIQAVLIAVSQMLADIPELAELDINPLLANEDGVVALDARIRLDPTGPAGAAHFAIRPYPAELAETVEWNGQTITLRPIRPEDEEAHVEFLSHLDPEDIRMRVFYSRRTMERSELARLTQIDYMREMAFIATAPGPDGQPRTLGVARALADPDNEEAEFGIIVRSELKGTGLGHLLMDKLIRYLRAHGTQKLVATVLRENQRMLALAQELGFQPSAEQPDPETVAIELPLN
ncbi:acetyltransferase [Tibeticola sediminis]|uniref:Acetyltransferase n=1 Tax=Tibeticola sediminis TaxID=1917811 RepID=A0A3N4U9J7_9BURK|nr:bifunctional acetate--CoA ligase family protein/GNAT family N-acetyltransferase [Tibeticola sediminis]RPE65045.1 acetyltransferase [Tibeticola sediminis]